MSPEVFNLPLPKPAHDLTHRLNRKTDGRPCLLQDQMRILNLSNSGYGQARALEQLKLRVRKVDKGTGQKARCPSCSA